ncbi:hypothetical protein G7054_g2980 [Neopestalotiopsis clavispora]|nr:hypothetical protein G7054_g2980 [Neopestalotiopsis clavispora]
MASNDNIEAAVAHPNSSVEHGDVVKGEVADEGYELFEDTAPDAFSQEAADAVRRKIDRHLLPLMCALYGLNYVDKVANGWAVLFDLRADLGLVGTEYSWASSMFYFGYLVAQYPANYILQRFQTARVLSISVIIWGVLMLGHLGLRNFAGFMVIRFLLGVAESVVTPGFVLYTSMFYTRKEQVWRTMLWAAMQGCFSIVTALISYGLGHITNTALRPWMYIFLVLGLLSLIVGFGWLFYMPQTPNKARFLSAEERMIAVQRVAGNMMGIKGYQWKSYQIWHAIIDPKVWLILAFVLFTQLPNGGLTSFGSLVVSGFGFDSFRTLLIGLPSSVVSAGSMIVWGTFSIKHGNLRTWGMIVPLLPAIAGIAAVYGTMNTGANKYGRVVAYWLINSYAVTWPFVLTIIGQNIAGHTKRAFTNTMMLILFATGNIAGPFFFRSQDAPRYVLAIASILVFFCVSLLCAVVLRFYMLWENKRRDRLYGAVETTEAKIDGMRTAILRTFTLKGLSTPYHALSYSWLGENSATNARQKHGVLKTEKGELPILDSVQDFVRVLKLKEGNFNDTWWWIDSLCINLADTEERNQQVQLMSEIYRNAHKLLNETVRQERNLEKTRRMFQQPQYEPHWSALASFFQRRWWSRIWTLQEYAMNANASFWWGVRSFSRSVVEGALIGADRCTSVGFKATPAFRHSFSRRRVRILYDTRQANNNRIQLTLVALAAYSSCFEATDDRDRLYGIQGLATDTSILEVNYSYDVEDTYMRFTKAFIEHYKSLDIICFASLYSAVHSSALPSWVPDWRARIDPLSVPLMVSQSAKDTIGNLRPSSLTFNVPGHSAPCYAASKESIPIYRFAELKLIACGTTVDVVDGLGGSENIGMVQSSAKLNSVKSLSQGMTASDILRSVCKSLVLDRKDRYMRFAMPADDFFRDFTWLCRHVTMNAPSRVPKEFAEWYLGTKDLLINGRSLETLLRESRGAANIELSSSAQIRTSTSPTLSLAVSSTRWSGCRYGL